MDKRCAYLTMDDIGDFVSDADLSFAPMAELGWQVDMVPWRHDVDWDDYDLVYILSLIHISEPTRQESRSRMPSSA